MTAKRNYWKGCMAQAAEECDLTLMDDQLQYLANAAEAAHEQYGMAFYSPPSGNGQNHEDAARKKRVTDELQRVKDQRDAYEMALRRALGLHSDDNIRVDRFGSVTQVT